MGTCLIHNRRFESGGGGGSLTLGETYSFGGYNWTCAETFNDYAVLQSQGITGGTWPGYAMTGPTTGTGDWGAVNTNYDGDIDGEDISGYNTTLSNLFSGIGSTEYLSASYGKGLYLIDPEMAGLPPGSTSSKRRGDLDLTGSKLNYYNAMITAALNHSSVGITMNYAWFGAHCNSYSCWAATDYNGTISYGNFQSKEFVIAPAFNVDLSKINVSSENVITVK